MADTSKSVPELKPKSEQHADTSEPARKLQLPKLSFTARAFTKAKLKITDIIAFGVMLIVIVVLTVTLIGKLRLKHDASAAVKVTDKIVAALDKRDGAAVRAYGTKTFQTTYSAEKLTEQFRGIESVTEGKPTLYRQTVADAKKGTTAIIVYKYPARLANMPYYVRVMVNDQSGSWQLTNISGTADTSQL